MLKTTGFDVAEYLDTEELRKGYLELVAKDGTQAELFRAINAVARARGRGRGMTETTKPDLFMICESQDSLSYNTRGR